MVVATCGPTPASLRRDEPQGRAMKHILYASTALGLLAGVALTASPAAATVISIGACTPTSLGTPCTPGAAITSSSTGTLTLASTPVGTGDFTIQGSAQAGVTP